jgi:hypothetical protein
MQISLRRLILTIILFLGLVFILASPFLLHDYAFITRLQRNQERWADYGAGEYEMRLASNSLTGCTGGWNTLHVRAGNIVAARNDSGNTCALDEFAQLTVEGIFARIWEECVQNRSLSRPLPYCNVAYDPDFGFPRRLDTYTLTADGEYAPSITVEWVRFVFQP